MKRPDVVVSGHGSVFLFDIISKRAIRWVNKCVAEPMYYGRTLVVDGRYAADCAQEMINNGLLVR